jgi:phage repressor protein C with HTH and peptisase S24 domain
MKSGYCKINTGAVGGFDMDELRKRFAIIIDLIKSDLDKGIHDEELAKILGTNKNTLRQYRRNQGLLKGEVLVNLVQHYNIDPRWLFKGEGEPFPDARERYPHICGPERSTGHGQPDHKNYHYFNESEGAKMCTGNEATLVDEFIAFRKDWIKKKGNPEEIQLIKVNGDAMEPTLSSGDMLLIDKSIKNSSGGGIYALCVNDEFMIRRIQYTYEGNKVKIFGDNQRYNPLEVDRKKVKINGRVVWVGRDIER